MLTLVEDGGGDKDLEEHVNLLTQETRDMHPFVELADTSKLRDLSAFTDTGVTLAGSLEFSRQPHKRDKLAILVANKEVYELANKYAATSSYFRYEVRIFKDYKEAITWLGVADLEDQINDMRELPEANPHHSFSKIRAMS